MNWTHHVHKPKHDSAPALSLKKLDPASIENINSFWEVSAGARLTDTHPGSSLYVLNEGDRKAALHIQSLVSDNPLLASAVAEIRDEYYQLLHEKTQILKHFEGLGEGLKGFVTHLAKSRDPRKKEMLQKVDIKLGVHNYAGLHRLMEQNYGFSDEAAAQILGAASTPAAQGLSEGDAKMVFGKTVGNALRAFKKHHRVEVDIPHSYLEPTEAVKVLEQLATTVGHAV